MFRSQSKSKSKSLKVERQTVRVLSASVLASAQGGDGPIFQLPTGGGQIYTVNNVTCASPQLSDPTNNGGSISMTAGSCITTGGVTGGVGNPRP
jgi:hypothetical protein